VSFTRSTWTRKRFTGLLMGGRSSIGWCGFEEEDRDLMSPSTYGWALAKGGRTDGSRIDVGRQGG